MLFKNLRAGDEVILATPTGRGAAAGLTYRLATVEAVKSALIVAEGYKFNLKDGRGRTVPHFLLPATPANRQEYLGGATAAGPAAGSELAAEAEAEGRQRTLARGALRAIRETGPADDDDLIDLLGTDVLAAFGRRWRQLRPGRG